MRQISLHGSCIVEKLDINSTVILSDDTTTEVKGYKFYYTMYNYRPQKTLPFIIKNKLKGVAKTNLDWVNHGSESLGGTFSIQINSETLEIAFDESTSSFKEKIQGLSGITSQDIEIKRYSHCPYGCRWSIRFLGEEIPITLVIDNFDLVTKDSEVNVTVNATLVQ